MNKLVLIDGNSIAYRAFYALPLLNNDKGMYTNAVFGFTTMLLKILETEKPTHLLVAFDAGKVTLRHADFQDYKGGRQKTPSELNEQFPMIRQLLDAFSIKHYELSGYEADDIIGTLSKQADNQEWTTKVVSGDKDMLQLVSEQVHVALTRKGISEVEYYDLAKLEEVYQLKPAQIIDLKGLMGDPSDNIPGVPGVGEKTALKLLYQFGSVENTYENLDQVSGKKLNENLRENKEKAFLSKSLATILRDAPLEMTLEDATFTGFEKEKVLAIFKEFGFNSLIERIGGKEETNVAEMEELQVKVVEEVDSSLWDQMLKSPVALQVEQLPDEYHKANILSFSISTAEGVYYIPAKVGLASERFKTWLEDEDKHKWMYDSKKAQVALAWQGISLRGVHFDIYLAAYLTNPSESTYELKDIATEYTSLVMKSDEETYGKGVKRAVPAEDAAYLQDVARKAKAIHMLKDKMEEKLEENHLLSLLIELEMPLSRVLAEMEVEGISVDQATLEQMGLELQQRLEELTTQIFELAGTEFNINSPKQLGEILFDKLGLPVIKKTKTGYSTNAEVLEKLAPQHEIIGKILDYRQLGKLQSTYVEGLLKVIDGETGKVHTNFQQTIAATGRLSSTDPNLQNIPIRLEEGRKIRKAFVPSKPEHYLIAADYSQIELRILAHISQDKGLIEAFQEGKDIHTKTAMDVFHVSEEEVTSMMRRHAKAVNFGIIYGISDYGLSQNLHITRKEAQDFIDRYFASFPGVKQFMEDVVVQAKKDGFVTTLLQRRRYLPDINSRNFNLRSFAERTAMNTPIQGTAADIIKKAMIEMSLKLKEENLDTKLLLQVHDELILEVPKHELERLLQLVPEVMESAMKLDVPLQVDVQYGQSWYDAK